MTNIWPPQNKGLEQISPSTSFLSSLGGESRQGTHHVQNEKITSRLRVGEGDRHTRNSNPAVILRLGFKYFCLLYSLCFPQLLPKRAGDYMHQETGITVTNSKAALYFKRLGVAVRPVRPSWLGVSTSPTTRS